LVENPEDVESIAEGQKAPKEETAVRSSGAQEPASTCRAPWGAKRKDSGEIVDSGGNWPLPAEG
jgi:hypothetical protein